MSVSSGAEYSDEAIEFMRKYEYLLVSAAEL